MRKNSILRIAILMLCVSMLTVLFCVNVSAAGTMNLTVDSVTAKPGDTVDVAIKITNNPGNLNVLIITISHDSSLELTKATNGTVFSTFTKDTNLLFDDDGTSANGTLVTLTFKVNSNAAVGTYDVKAVARECYDSELNDISVSVTNGKITVECAHKNTKSVAAKSATCVDKGYTAGVYCNDCETYVSGHDEVAATGKHTYGTPTVTKAATCTEKGSQTKTCTGCDKTVTEDVPAKGHTPEVTEKAVPATCTESGLTEGSRCSVCDTVISAQETVPALGHNKVTNAAKAPTCTKTGLTEGSSCSRCGEVYTAQETVPALGHKEVKDAAKDPTCTESGLTEGSHCSSCNTVIKAQTVISATGHNYGDWVVTKEATETETGEKTQTCENCGNVVTEEIPMIAVDTDDTTAVPDDTDDTDDTTAVPDDTDDTDDTTVGTDDTAENSGETTDNASGTEPIGNGGEGTDDDGDGGKKICWICWLIILLLILLILATIYYVRKKMKEKEEESQSK